MSIVPDDNRPLPRDLKIAVGIIWLRGIVALFVAALVLSNYPVGAAFDALLGIGYIVASFGVTRRSAKARWIVTALVAVDLVLVVIVALSVSYLVFMPLAIDIVLLRALWGRRTREEFESDRPVPTTLEIGETPPAPPQVWALLAFLGAVAVFDLVGLIKVSGTDAAVAGILTAVAGCSLVAGAVMVWRLSNVARLAALGLVVLELLGLILSVFIAGALYAPTTFAAMAVCLICLYLARSDDIIVAINAALEGGGTERAVITVAPQLPPKPGEADREVLYSIRGLTKHFPIRGGVLNRQVGAVQAVDDVSFDIYRGETIGLVGESGCGKTTTGRLLLRLIEATQGQLVFEGRDLRKLTYQELKPFRAKMQIIFQDPYASLNPRLPVGDIIGEGLYNFGVRRAAERERRVAEMLEIVGLRKYYINRYPHEFSGGQRQRIGIARALVLRPSFVIADEPVSALDVSIQAQVLNLLKDLQDELKLTYVFISHNLSVVEHISDRVGVMYLGKLVELADSTELYKHPQHPYTQALLSAVPVPDPTLRRERILLAGDVPSPINPPSGCRFHTRCPLRQALLELAERGETLGQSRPLGEPCVTDDPTFEPKGGNARHLVACHYADTVVERELEEKVAL